MSTYLNGSFGYSAGAFTTYNTGQSGKGWGINTSNFMEIIQDKTYQLSHLGGLVIDLYSLIYMNPFEEFDFLVDIPLNQDYFEINQIGNLIFIIPNSSKIIDDNFKDELFIVNVDLVGKNGTTKTESFNIDYKKNNPEAIQIENIELTYKELNFDIPLINLINIDNQFEISKRLFPTHINGIPLNLTNISVDELIQNESIKTSKLSNYYNPVIQMKYESYGITFNFKITLKNSMDNKKPETLIEDIYVEINQANGELIDVKEHVFGNTEFLIIKEISVQPTNELFNMEVCGHFINLFPNTLNIIKLSGPKIIYKKFMYQTNNCKGVFDLIISIDPSTTYKDELSLTGLVPNIKDISITLTNGKFYGHEYLNIENLLGNRIYSDTKPRLTILEPVENLEAVNVGGPKLYIPYDKAIVVPSIIKLELSYGTKTFIINLKVEDDKVLYKEPLDMSSMVFKISKNQKTTLNIYDYIFANNDQYENLNIKIADASKFVTYGTYPTQIIAPKDDLLTGITEITTVTGIITIYTPSYIGNNNFDDYGNIIGLREIPYSIIIDPDDTLIDSLNVETVNIYLDNLNYIEYYSAAYRPLGNLRDLTKIQSVTVDPLTTITDIEYCNGTLPDPNLPKTLSITVNENKTFSIFWIKPSELSRYLTLMAGTKLVLKIEYLDNNNAVATYFQIFNILKKHI